MIFGLIKRDIEPVLEEWAKGFKFLFDVIYLLPPHHAHFRKRIVKRPKMIFLDTGIASRLIGLEDPLPRNGAKAWKNGVRWRGISQQIPWFCMEGMNR